jgi:hypothetical protein
MHRYLDSLPLGRRLIICWQRLQLRRIYLLGLIGLRERVGPSSEGTRRAPSQRPYRVACVRYLSCAIRGASLYFVHCDVVWVMFKEAIRRPERDDDIPLPILPCSRECFKLYNTTHHRIQGEDCKTSTKLYFPDPRRKDRLSFHSPSHRVQSYVLVRRLVNSMLYRVSAAI